MCETDGGSIDFFFGCHCRGKLRRGDVGKGESKEPTLMVLGPGL